MAKVNWRAGALVAPVPPALVTCGTAEAPNVLTVAWTGILCTKPPKTYISVRPERHSYGLLKQTGEFVINLPPSTLARTVDLCGMKSGRDTDKFALTGLTAEESACVSAPSLAQCPISLECRVCDVVPLGSHDMLIADIVSIGVDPAFVDKAGRLMIEKCDLMAFAHGTYFSLGKQLGTFGYSVRKKPGKTRAKTAKNQRSAKGSPNTGSSAAGRKRR